MTDQNSKAYHLVKLATMVVWCVPESLVLTDDILNKAYKSESRITNASITTSKELPYLSHDITPQWSSDYPQGFRDLLPIKTSVDPTRPGLKITQLGYGYSAGDTEYENGYFAANSTSKIRLS